MMHVQLFSLYSGSTGNAFLIRSEQGAILIDAGKNNKQLCTALAATDTSPEQIRAIFLTHEHVDHIGALPVFLKRHPVPVHVAQGSAAALRMHPSAAACLHTHTPLFSETVCGMCISSFPTPHDSAASVGYRIDVPTENGVLRIGYATDIGHVSQSVEESLLGCDAVILESNHDPELLRTGPYPYPLKQRIASRYGHLSNPDCAAFAARLCQSGTKSLMLAHLSAENNTPQLALDTCREAIAPFSGISLCVARPGETTELCMEGIL